MQRTLFGTLSVLLLSAAAAPAALAGEVAINTSDAIARGTSPFALVNQAQRGQLDGMPGFAQFDTQVELGRIDAEDVVRAGIAEGRLSANALDDEGYVNAVKTQLRGLHSGS